MFVCMYYTDMDTAVIMSTDHQRVDICRERVRSRDGDCGEDIQRVR